MFTGTSKSPELPSVVPEIPVSDIEVATTYYRDRLRFTLDWVEPDIALAGLSRDSCRLFLAGPSFRKERGNVSPVLMWINLSRKAEVNALYETWRATNAIVLPAPESNSWGLHEFTAADPDGN